MLKRYEFDQEGVKYVRANLTRGLTLSGHLLELPLEDGKVFSFLPETVDPEATRRFGVGGLVSTEMVGEVEQAVADLIASYLARPARTCAVFEDSTTRPGDGSLLRSTAKYFTCGEEVYFLLPHQEIETEKIINTLRSVSSWTFNGVLARAEGLRDIEPRKPVETEVLQTLALNSEYILVGAYDSEGYLIWARD